MELSISPVKPEDVDLLVRKVEYPAHQDSPLTRLMFPRSTGQGRQREDVIQWTIDWFLETVHRGTETLFKACRGDGSPVGLIGWTNNAGIDDVSAWLSVSKQLREERKRVLQDHQGNAFCRITSMAVDPNYQRQGIGSKLLETFCLYVDEIGLDAFVMSSPTGVEFYSKFSFKVVGVVETEQGPLTSMMRARILVSGIEA